MLAQLVSPRIFLLSHGDLLSAVNFLTIALEIVDYPHRC